MIIPILGIWKTKMRLYEIESSDSDDLPVLTKEHKVLSYMKRGAAMVIRPRLTPPFREAYLIKLNDSEQRPDAQWYDIKDVFFRIPSKLARRVKNHPDIMRYWGFSFVEDIKGKLYTNTEFFNNYVDHIDDNTDFGNMED